MKFIDFTRKYKRYKKELDAITRRVFTKGIFILGPEAEKFEQALATYVGTKYAVALNSGTDALYLSMKALGIGPGDEVITVSYTATPTVNAICMTGATPVLIDIQAHTINMDTTLLEKAITKKTKAIIPVHFFGLPVHMDDVMRIAKKHNLHVIEDACQAIGARYKKKNVGAIGTAGCFSFYPTKNLGAFGDAGAVVTNSKKISDEVRSLRAYGEERKFYSVKIGVNSRMDSLQAAYLNWGIKKINQWNAQRQQHAKLYLRLLQDIPGVQLPATGDATYQRIWHVFALQVAKRDALQAYLKTKGIPTMVHYHTSVYQQPAYHHLGATAKQLPVTTSMTQNIISLPLYPELTKAEIIKVCRAIKAFYEK